MHYASEHGIDPRRNDLFHGQLAALIHNCNRGKDTPIARPIDYMVYSDKPELTQEEFEAKTNAIIDLAKALRR